MFNYTRNRRSRLLAHKRRMSARVRVEELEPRTLLATSVLGPMPLMPAMSGPMPAGQTQLVSAPTATAIPTAPQFPPQAAQPVLSRVAVGSAAAPPPLSNSGTVPIVPNEPTSPLTPTSAISQGAPANGLAGAAVTPSLTSSPASPTGGPVTVATTPFATGFTASPVQGQNNNPFSQLNGEAPATTGQPITSAALGTSPIYGSVLSPLPGQSLPLLAAGPNPDITVPDANVQSNVFTMANPIRLLMFFGGVPDRDPEDVLDEDYGGDAVGPAENNNGPPQFEAIPAPAPVQAPARGPEAPPPQDETEAARLPEPLWPPASEAYFANVAAPAEETPDAAAGETVLPAAGGTPTQREALTALAGAVLLGGASWQREARDENARRRRAEVPAGPV